MRIGIDSRLPHYRGGGISRYIRQLIRSLAELNASDDFLIFHSRKDGSSHIPSSANNFRRVNLATPSHHRFERWSLGLEYMPHALRVLHSPDFIPPQFGAARKVITVHDLNFLYYPEFLTAESRRYYNDQIKWAVQKADHIIADSTHTKDDLISMLKVDPEKISPIHLAADPVFSSETSASEIKSTLERFNLPEGFLLFVGTISPRKNLSTLLKAYSQLVHELSLDQPLIIAGPKGWLFRETFELIDRLDLTEKVRLIEDTTDIELVHIYKSASLLALPSFYEGFGLPVLEAMHCGCPVLASNRSALPEVAGDAALLLDPEDVDAWSQALSDVLSDTNKKNLLVERGLLQVEKYSWKKTAEQTMAVYDDK